MQQDRDENAVREAGHPGRRALHIQTCCLADQAARQGAKQAVRQPAPPRKLVLEVCDQGAQRGKVPLKHLGARRQRRLHRGPSPKPQADVLIQKELSHKMGQGRRQ